MATFYIDPSLPTNGNGTLATPYNTWVGVTLTANNVYLQKRGTVYTGASVRPQSQVSAAATPLTIGAYFNADGSDDASRPRPIVDHNGGTNGVGAIFVDTCTNVLVRDMAGRNSRASLGGGVTVRRSVGVTVLRCATYDNEHGICIQQDQASGTSVCTDIAVTDCEVYANVGGGITMRWGAVSTAVLRRVAITGSIIFGNGTGKGIGAGAVSVPCGGISSYTQNKASIGTAGFQSFDITVQRNRVYDNNGYGINVEGFANDTMVSSVSRNLVWGNGASGDVDSHSLWVGNSTGVLIERNRVWGNRANIGATTGSGVGIFIDYNALSTAGGASCIVRRNVIYDQFMGSTQAPAIAASAGILVLANANTRVEDNLVVNCRNGISVGNGTATDGTLVTNNTIVNCANSGVNVLPMGTNTLVRNNLIKGGATGLFINTTSTAGSAESYNLLHGCTVAKANGTATAQTPTALDVTDKTSDPRLTSDYRLAPSSPAFRGGTHLGYRRDLQGRQRQRPPCIGAFDTPQLRARLK